VRPLLAQLGEPLQVGDVLPRREGEVREAPGGRRLGPLREGAQARDVARVVERLADPLELVQALAQAAGLQELLGAVDANSG
jgi:hypothetical protein